MKALAVRKLLVLGALLLAGTASARDSLGVFENWEPVIPESYQGAKYVMLGNMVPMIQYKTLHADEK